MVISADPFIFEDPEKAPPKKVALVLGAGVFRDGRLTDMLGDRIKIAIQLYKLNKVDKILVSGDHGQVDYDEVTPMKNHLIKGGVPEEDIVVDHAGFDTYDSVYRAKAIFKVPSLIIVTQKFHLSRAVYAARALEIDAAGVTADLQKYQSIAFNYLREIPARTKIFFDLLFQAKPKFLGKPEPIFSYSGSSASMYSSTGTVARATC